ncbi:MAG: hypothetical protein H7096_13985 [Flavobacterium sp.]|nr:hypothetical protein [Pedobacter sp.]
MKKFSFLFVIAGSLLSSTSIAQQDSSGIYKTADDFQKRKLSFAVNYKTERQKINHSFLFNNSEIKVTHNGEKHKLSKSKTYGYRSTKGEEFRFVDNKYYKVLNPGQTLLMYVYNHPFRSPKDAQKYLPAYFFSIDAASVPQLLTKANIKAAYPVNHKFHDALDAVFNNDGELYAYDGFHKMYKLNWILSR